MQKKQATGQQILRWSLSTFLMAVISLTVCAPILAQGNFAGHAEQVLPYLHSVYADSFVEIRSDVTIPEPSLIASQIAQAYRFDLRSQGLTASVLNQPLVVGLYSNAVWAKGGGNAIGTEYFVANVGPYLRFARNLSDQRFAWLVTAHELEHLIMSRMNAPVAKVPIFLFEGIACSLGYRFAVTTVEGNYDSQYVAGRLVACTRADAEDMLKNFMQPSDYQKARDSGKIWQYENMGGLFFEHLISLYSRTPDYIFKCWGKLVESIGHGVAFESAFKSAFPFSLSAAENDFLSYMEKTTGNPRVRFAGTIFSDAYR